MATKPQSLLAVPSDEIINSVNKGVPKDHHYANTEGYLLQFYHLFPRLYPRTDNKKDEKKMFGVTNDELVFIIHLSRFDFDDSQLVKPSLATIAENIGEGLRTIHNYKKSCVDAGLILVHSHAQEGSPSDYDFSPIYIFCYQEAEKDGWFYRKTLKKKEGGMQALAQGGMQALAQGGMQALAHKESSLQDLSNNNDSVVPAETTVEEDVSQAEELAKDRLAEIRIKEFAKEIGKLPKGQQQRVFGIIRALATWQHATRNSKAGTPQKRYSSKDAWLYEPEFPELKTARQYEKMADALKTFMANFGDVYKLDDFVFLDEAYMDAFGRWWSLVNALAMTTQKTSKEGKKLYAAIMNEKNHESVIGFMKLRDAEPALQTNSSADTDAGYDFHVGLDALISMYTEAQHDDTGE
jgi:hypothetical protein